MESVFIKKKKQEESKKRTWINLPSSLAHTGRERFIVTLFIEDGSGQVIELEKEFYSSNPHIKKRQLDYSLR